MINGPESPLGLHLRACKEGNAVMLEEAFTSNATFLGTDDTEVWPITDLIQLLRDNSGGWRMDLKNRITTPVTSSVSRFLEFLEHETYGPMRGSGLVIMDKKDGRWKILNYITTSVVLFPTMRLKEHHFRNT